MICLAPNLHTYETSKKQDVKMVIGRLVQGVVKILQESRVVWIMRKRLVRKAFDMILGISVSENREVGGRKDKYTDVNIDGVCEEWSTFVSNFIFR
ncbi:hypothetical protein L1987_03552 [Smallanthus sonchifolius]|uniref:Uncharacterized protein n=1 Tax=Smallanthus sonchifolius TaxID=185202 RepID=A0ACB9KAZ1_9ASTR|nr:hypothetical protein L1987_03552 [Smallanthus sonchifolius]